ncbi:hypothetical protein AG1IA_06779 [Rhizoctonia solani AG-1 IA]|uniref:Uncharacterized protein n=1 Tax=Thanatephorus cucumeris (strain AG1-IA) TaxID=983506 RepID=L8WS36_THACA|nr:hypothetical protein AG1IA_06779 [Rhizoctonia solani AG-1 IA]
MIVDGPRATCCTVQYMCKLRQIRVGLHSQAWENTYRSASPTTASRVQCSPLVLCHSLLFDRAKPAGRVFFTTYNSIRFFLIVLRHEGEESTTRRIASNPSVPLATSAWSKGPPQSSATSRAQSPANAPSTPTTQSRRQSSLGQGANATVKQASRGVATGTGHRQAR